MITEVNGRWISKGYSFEKISEATKRTRQDCCKFFYDNMDGYCFFSLLDELDKQYVKDGKKGFKTRGGCSKWTDNESDLGDHKKQFPMTSSFTLYAHNRAQFRISVTENALLRAGAIICKNGYYTKPSPDDFQQKACAELNKVRDRAIGCLLRKQQRRAKKDKKNNELMRKYPLEKAENILSTIPELSRTCARMGTPKAAEADENATDVKNLKSPPEEMIEDASATKMRGTHAKSSTGDNSIHQPPHKKQKQRQPSKSIDVSAVAQRTRSNNFKQLKSIASNDPIDLTVDDTREMVTTYTKTDVLSEAWKENLLETVSMKHLDKLATIEVMASTFGTSFNKKNRQMYRHILEKDVIFCPTLDSGHWVLFLVWMPKKW